MWKGKAHIGESSGLKGKHNFELLLLSTQKRLRAFIVARKFIGEVMEFIGHKQNMYMQKIS